MARIRNSAEGGTNGTTVTVANSGGASGDAVAQVTNIVFDNTWAAHGLLSYRETPSTSSVLRWAIGSVTGVSIRTYVRLSATGTANLIRLSHNTDTTASVVLINTLNRLRLNAKSSTSLWAGSIDLPINQTIRVEVFYTQGTTTSNGQAKIAYYLGDSTTPVEESPLITTANFGGDIGPFTQVRIGSENTSVTQTTRHDDIAINTGSDSNGYVGPYVANASPTYRWNSGTSAYVRLDTYRWDAGTSAYIALDRPTA